MSRFALCLILSLLLMTYVTPLQAADSCSSDAHRKIFEDFIAALLQPETRNKSVENVTEKQIADDPSLAPYREQLRKKTYDRVVSHFQSSEFKDQAIAINCRHLTLEEMQNYRKVGLTPENQSLYGPKFEAITLEMRQLVNDTILKP